jgi:hypothetical protein
MAASADAAIFFVQMVVNFEEVSTGTRIPQE